LKSFNHLLAYSEHPNLGRAGGFFSGCEMPELIEYACENALVFDRLKNQSWFEGFVKYQYRRVVFGASPLAPIFSDYWISQAYIHYEKDVDRVSNNEFQGKPLDHFKRAGFLSYWLRRCPPIAEFGRNPDLALAGIKLRDPHALEKFHGNQWAAFDIGFRICRFFEAYRKDSASIYGKHIPIDAFTLQGREEYIKDLCYVLSDKNISPHAIGIIYRSLFIQAR
jgi:hypothetical protein